jgi:hypothetical protein
MAMCDTVQYWYRIMQQGETEPCQSVLSGVRFYEEVFETLSFAVTYVLILRLCRPF